MNTATCAGCTERPGEGKTLTMKHGLLMCEKCLAAKMESWYAVAMLDRPPETRTNRELLLDALGRLERIEALARKIFVLRGVTGLSCAPGAVTNRHTG